MPKHDSIFKQIDDYESDKALLGPILKEAREDRDEIKKLRVELSKHAIIERHRMASEGGTLKVGYWCKVCDSEWSNGQAPRHTASCLLAGGR